MKKIVHKGFQFKLNPTPEQEHLFRQFCGSVRWVYNHMLDQRKAAYQNGQQLSTNDQIKELPQLKQQQATSWLNTIHSQVLQDAVLDLDDTFNRFFNKQTRYPKFKTKHGKRQSFSYPQGDHIKLDGNRVCLPKIGWVQFIQHRPLQGALKRVTIKCKNNRWYISFLCEVEIDVPDPVAITSENSVGIDLGSITLITLSTGEKVDNPRFHRRNERKLKREQRSLSRKVKGSKNYIKQKQRLTRLHERTAHQRQDYLHKQSFRLVRENQAILAEDLNVKGMSQNRRMGKSVADASWSELVRQLKYKADWQGKTFYQIGRYEPSSKKCHVCSYKHADLELKDRAWRCPNCKSVHDRDLNAALNIKAEGLKHLLAAGQTERLNACGGTVRLSKRARLAEARSTRPSDG